MNCPVCYEPVQGEWHFCRWCGTTVGDAAGAPAQVQTNTNDAVLNSLLSGAQNIGARPDESRNSMSYSEYLGYLQAGIVPAKR